MSEADGYTSLARMESVHAPGHLTAEQFAKLPSTDGRRELVRGEVIEMPPTGPWHGGIHQTLSLRLGGYVREKRLGRVYINTGFILARDPDVVRGPDEAFVSTAKMRAHPPPKRGFWEIAPDLAAEVMSPDDRAKDIAEKVEDYLNGGVRLVWIIDPKKRRVLVHRPGQPVAVLGDSDALEGGDVIPGFEMKIRDLWE